MFAALASHEMPSDSSVVVSPPPAIATLPSITGLQVPRARMPAARTGPWPWISSLRTIQGALLLQSSARMPSELVAPAEAEIDEPWITVPVASPMMWMPIACVPCAPQIVLVSTDAPGDVSRSTAPLMPVVAAPTRPPMPSDGVTLQSLVQRPVALLMVAQFSWIVGVESRDHTP